MTMIRLFEQPLAWSLRSPRRADVEEARRVAENLRQIAGEDPGVISDLSQKVYAFLTNKGEVEAAYGADTYEEVRQEARQIVSALEGAVRAEAVGLLGVYAAVVEVLEEGELVADATIGGVKLRHEGMFRREVLRDTYDILVQRLENAKPEERDVLTDLIHRSAFVDGLIERRTRRY